MVRARHLLQGSFGRVSTTHGITKLPLNSPQVLTHQRCPGRRACTQRIDSSTDRPINVPQYCSVVVLQHSSMQCLCLGCRMLCSALCSRAVSATKPLAAERVSFVVTRRFRKARRRGFVQTFFTEGPEFPPHACSACSESCVATAKLLSVFTSLREGAHPVGSARI